MKVKVRDIVSSGLEFYEQALPADLDIQEDFIDLECPVTVRGHLKRADCFILAAFEVTYTVDTVCARCLDNIHHEVMVKCDLEFDFKPGDEYIDLGQGVREEILLHYSLRSLCRENCLGICTGCGAYLNEEDCRCQKQVNS